MTGSFLLSTNSFRLDGRQGLRLLCSVWVRSAFVNEELLVHSATKAVLRQHALDSALDGYIRTTGDEFLGCFCLLASGIAGVSQILLVFHLVASELNSTRVDNDYIIAAVEVRSIVGLVLATQDVSNLGSHPAHGLVGSVYHIPVTLNDLLVGALGLKTEVSHDQCKEIIPGLLELGNKGLTVGLAKVGSIHVKKDIFH